MIKNRNIIALHTLLLLLVTFFFSKPAVAQVDQAPAPPTERVYTAQDSDVQPASYPGGERAMYGYLAQSVRYPRKAVKHNTTGKVVVTVIVEKDGSITNATIIQDIGDGCGESVLRAVKRMQRWHCATKNRIPVRYQVRIPVTFRL